MPMDKETEETYSVSQKAGITPLLDKQPSDDLPTGQIRMVDNGPAKPTGPKKGFAK